MRRWIGALAVLLLWNACKFNNNTRTLPIYGSRHSETKIVNGHNVTDTVYQTIAPFNVVNQYGDSITNKNLEGKIYVADFFFTSCPSICPVMQRNMLNIYKAWKSSPDFKILSFTIDPKYDSVKVLKKYADKLGVTGNSWWFIQGKKDDTYRLAEKSFLVSVAKDSTAPGGYVHQGYFVLVDKHQRVRGAYDGTNLQQVSQLINDIKTLKQQPAVAANQ